jgi:hypothetical protein
MAQPPKWPNRRAIWSITGDMTRHLDPFQSRRSAAEH